MNHPTQSPLSAPASLFLSFLMVVTVSFQVHSDIDMAREQKTTPVQNDTTEILTAGPWLHKKRDKKEYDSTFVRKFHFIKGGHFTIEITGTQLQKTDPGTWYRKGKSIITDLYSAPGEHQWEIIRLEKDTLLLYFVDRNVTDLLVRP